MLRFIFIQHVSKFLAELYSFELMGLEKYSFVPDKKIDLFCKIVNKVNTK